MQERKENYLQKTAEGLFKTFVHRADCFALQSENGQYFSVKEPLTVNHLIRHLKGEITLAVYLLGLDGTAKFSVIDADDENGLEKLSEVQETLQLPSYLETSRRGGHLWFFFADPVSGKVAKNFGLEIAKRFLIEAEVFPKQSESQGPGSNIRLPFGVHRKTTQRYPFAGLGDWRTQLGILLNPAKIPTEDVLKYQYQEPERKRISPTVFTDLGKLPLWEKVKRQITVEELVSQYVDLNAKGVGKCPFHDDVNPSFSVNPKENYWHCFSGCGGGSVIDFWMKMNNLDFKEATMDLAEKLGLK
jgi:hypothetical protein